MNKKEVEAFAKQTMKEPMNLSRSMVEYRTAKMNYCIAWLDLHKKVKKK